MHISNQLQSFTYHGSKFSYLPWLLPLIDMPCKHFIDVFGGSGAVIINRKPAPIETYNDINVKVVNFFKVLREQPEILISQLELTPHSKYEYTDAWYNDTDNDIEKARKFFIRTQQSIWATGAQEKVKGWAASIRDSRCTISEKTHRWIRAIEGLQYVAERFKLIQLECRDFRFILKKYDDPNTFFYCDSPYDMTLRSSTAYEFDFVNQDFHDLHYYASHIAGKIAISNYDTPFMSELFKDFKKHIGPQRKNNRSKKIALECIWTNY